MGRYIRHAVASTESTGRRTQAERRAASERALLDATGQLIAERGTTSASLAEIAALAGCSHSHPTYLFGNKAGLLEAFVRDASEQLTDLLILGPLRELDGLEALLGSVDQFVRSLRAPWPQTRAMYVLIGESLGGDSALQPALNAYHERLRELAAGWLAEGIEAGEIRADLDVDATAALVLGLVRGIGYGVLSDPTAADIDVLAESAVAFVRRAVVGA